MQKIHKNRGKGHHLEDQFGDFVVAYFTGFGQSAAAIAAASRQTNHAASRGHLLSVKPPLFPILIIHDPNFAYFANHFVNTWKFFYEQSHSDQRPLIIDLDSS